MSKLNNEDEKADESHNMHLYYTEDTAQSRPNGITFMNRLNNEIKMFIENIKPSREEAGLRRPLIKMVKGVILDELDKIKEKRSRYILKQKTVNYDIIERDQEKNTIVCIGSHVTRMYLPAGDINMTLLTNEKNILERIRNAIYKNDFILQRSISLQQDIEMPVLKFRDICGFRYDITLNNRFGIAQTKAVKRMLREWPHLRKMALFLKYFLRSRGLHGRHRGGLCTNAQLLLLVNFLDLHPRLPWELPASRDLSALLLEFFQFYGFDLHYDRARMAFLRYRKDYAFSHLFTEDPADGPFEKSNLMKRITAVCELFTDAYKTMASAAQQYANNRYFVLPLWVIESGDDVYWRERIINLYYKISVN